MKKVAFIGTHGTGKTTLVYELASCLKKLDFNVDVLTEVSRENPFPINEQTTRESQKWILFTQYIKEIEKEGKCDYLICDRSLVDNYAYYVKKFGRDEKIEPFILDHMKTYFHLFKVPINKKYLTYDGKRSIDETFQKEIDGVVNDLLIKFEIPFQNYTCLNYAIEKILE
jgi:nicotinamide riboside kinase